MPEANAPSVTSVQLTAYFICVATCVCATNVLCNSGGEREVATVLYVELTSET